MTDDEAKGKARQEAAEASTEIAVERAGSGSASLVSGEEPTAMMDASRPATASPVLSLETIEQSRYEIEEPLASGGMGRILRARDRYHGRPVAIKELLTSSPELEVRFCREARITARLQHPAVVPVYEAGRWPSGEPFYVMKEVEGRSLGEVIAEEETLLGRLGLLPNVIAVADALAYAHEKHVIHRDLKPANVLVGRFGETVVIDWGLAKDLREQDEAEAAEASAPELPASSQELTVHGVAIGTPSYMPPEQARGDAVDERADVYAIGAILYHLLAGNPPYNDTSPKSTRELLDQVVARPPTALAALLDDVPPDLLAIVGKAMARDPRERYPSATELARDLRRFQTGKLVGAHRYTTRQLLGRWVRRHRGVVTVAAIAIAVLTASAGLGVQRIRRERGEARKQQRIAEQNRAEVEELLGFMLVDLRDKLEPVGRLDVLDLVARRAAEYYRARPVDERDPRAAWKRAISFNNVGKVLESSGDLEAALDRYRVSLVLLDEIARRAPEEPEYRRDLAIGHDNIGDILAGQGDLAGAMTEYVQARAIRTRLAEEEPSRPQWQDHLAISHSKIGTTLRKQGKLEAALREFRAALALDRGLADRDPDEPQRQRAVATHHLSIGDVLRDLGNLDEAAVEYRAAREMREAISARDPDNAKWQRDLAVAYERTADLFLRQRAPARALEMSLAALAIAERLAERDPSNDQRQLDLSVQHEYVGTARLESGDLAGARASLETTLAIRQRLADKDRSNAKWQRGLVHALEGLGRVDEQQARRKDALARYRAALAVAEPLAAAHPDHAGLQADAGRIRAALQRLEAAEQ